MPRLHAVDLIADNPLSFNSITSNLALLSLKDPKSLNRGVTLLSKGKFVDAMKVFQASKSTSPGLPILQLACRLELKDASATKDPLYKSLRVLDADSTTLSLYVGMLVHHCDKNVVATLLFTQLLQTVLKDRDSKDWLVLRAKKMFEAHKSVLTRVKPSVELSTRQLWEQDKVMKSRKSKALDDLMERKLILLRRLLLQRRLLLKRNASRRRLLLQRKRTGWLSVMM